MRKSPTSPPRPASRPIVLAGALILLSLRGLDLRSETLRVITIDSASMKPVPARVSVLPEGGRWLAGRDAEGKPFSTGGLPRLWSDGTIDIDVPAGKAQVIASRPFAHLPASTDVLVGAGGTAEVKLFLKPVVDLKSRGWYGGDAHCHVVHGERQCSVDLRTVVPIARAEGLDWTAFGEDWTSREERQPSPRELSELCRELSDATFLAAWTKEHPKDHLGHMACFPLGVEGTFEEAVGSNAYESAPGKRENFTHFEILRSLQALGTISIYTHPTREYGGSAESPANIARELPFDVVAAPWALEGLDVLTDAPDNGANLRLWSFLLDRGLRLPACGFSDTCYDRRDERPGDTRTYVGLSGARTMENIVGGIRGGRTFATTGPLVLFTVEGRPVGSVLPADGKGRKALVRAWNAVDHSDPRKPAFLERVLVLRNGKPWRELRPERETHEGEWTLDLEERETSWYAVQVQGSSPLQFAVTSPVYFEGEDRRPPVPAQARVRGKVTGAGGEPLQARVLAVEHGKGRREVVSAVETAKGEYRIRCPATCRIRVEAEGREPLMKSIFLDFDPLYRDLFLPIRRDRLYDPEFYREIERRLDDVTLDFELSPAR